GEGLGDLPARPVVRVVQRPAARRTGGVQPARADDREEQVAAVHGAQQGPLEVLSRADRLAGAEDLVRPEAGGELAFDECRTRLLIAGAVVDENAVQTVFSSSVVSGGGGGTAPEGRESHSKRPERILPRTTGQGSENGGFSRSLCNGKRETAAAGEQRTPSDQYRFAVIRRFSGGAGRGCPGTAVRFLLRPAATAHPGGRHRCPPPRPLRAPAGPRPRGAPCAARRGAPGTGAPRRAEGRP